MEIDLAEDQKERHTLLETAMSAVGLEIRKDSDLSWDYILYGDKAKVSKDVTDISTRMAQAEYLHKYCEFQLGYDVAQAIAKKRNKTGQPALPYQQWLLCINECVLQTTLTGVYPERWPWLMEQSFTPEEWRVANLHPDWQ